MTNLGIRHVDNAFVALCATDVGETNAGVSSRTLNNGTSRLQPTETLVRLISALQQKRNVQSLLLRIPHHAKRRTVLDTPPRILELGLAKNLRADLLRQRAQVDLSTSQHRFQC